MRREKKISWKDLKVGFMIIGVLVLIAIGIILIGKEVPLLSKKYKIVTYLDDVSGLKVASLVMLAGVEVGLIDSVHFKPEARKVAVSMKISTKYQPWIRSDSVAYVKTMGALGDKYIDITIGSSKAEILQDGDEIKGRSGLDIDHLIADASDTIGNINSLTSSLSTIASELKNGKGTVGKLITKDDLHRELISLITKVSNGKGTLAQLINDKDVYNNIKSASADLSILTKDIKEGKSGIGKLIKNDQFATNVINSSEKIADIIQDIHQGKGTIGKLFTDENLYRNVSEFAEAITPVAEDISKGRGTLGKLAQDKTLYENTNRLIQEARLLLTDIRENPKKYLHIKLSLF